MPTVRGSGDGWLRILRANDLLRLVHGGKALDAMWRQSRLAQIVWERDLLPAVHRYAEYVQLMPASESHHHAHVGGLLSHTLEMTLAAMTWRNGHFFPEGASVEEMDAQRDEWTYVVFFAALLHDIGKIMTDLRLSWICEGMDQPVRWVPMSGPLSAMVQSRVGGEYLVEFTPKSARDYQAHSRLATILLQQVAPATALSFLARRPQAFEALTQYLSGADKGSLLAQLVRRADQTSTQQALASGSRERFSTSTSVPLIDLLMQSIRDMLRTGTSLPLNRSGAAGWVFDGSVWFVAKRLADAVRQHIRERHPDESVPGEHKNDRLFDTWQEYGCVLLNSQTGQAVWYVEVHGSPVVAESAAEQGGEGQKGEGDGSYRHALSMLRFPLDKIYEDASAYPPAMRGRIEVKVKAAGDGPASEGTAEEGAAGTPRPPRRSPSSTADKGGGKPKTELLRAPAFARGGNASATSGGKSESSHRGAPAPAAVTSPPAAQAVPRDPEVAVPPTAPSLDPPLDQWLDFDDDVGAFKAFPPTPPKESTARSEDAVPPSHPAKPERAAKPSPKVAVPKSAQAAPTVAKPAAKATPAEPPALPPMPQDRPLLVRSALPPEVAARAAPARLQTAPVLLNPFLPELPHETAGKQTEPSATAVAFIEWLQQGLANRELKYNETGAVVHFTAEGMALVSPLVFRKFVADQDPATDAEADAQALQVQREVIKAGWHLMGPGKVNILKYQVMGRGGVPVGKLSAVVLTQPDRWVMPVPPVNPVLKLS